MMLLRRRESSQSWPKSSRRRGIRRSSTCTCSCCCPRSRRIRTGRRPIRSDRSPYLRMLRVKIFVSVSIRVVYESGNFGTLPTGSVTPDNTPKSKFSHSTKFPPLKVSIQNIFLMQMLVSVLLLLTYPSVLKVVIRVVQIHGHATLATDAGNGCLGADLKEAFLFTVVHVMNAK